MTYSCFSCIKNIAVLILKDEVNVFTFYVYTVINNLFKRSLRIMNVPCFILLVM